MTKKHLLQGLLLFAVMPLAHSTPILSQPVLDDGTSFGTFSSLTAGNQSADNFTLSQGYRVSGLTWWGSYDAYSPEDLFTIRLFSDNDGAPSTTADVLNTVSPAITRTELTDVTDYFGSQIYRYDMTLDLILGSEDYYLSILNDADESWYWADAVSGDLANWFRADDGDTWLDSGEYYDLAFMLRGTAITQVPVSEPSGLLILLSGLGAVLSIRRIRQSMS